MTKKPNKRYTLSPTEKAAISLGLLNNIAEYVEHRDLSIKTFHNLLKQLDK